ncbi:MULTISPECIES: DUF1835 domain-containing protein [unclassified Paenibacillus]|uniref:DUF1835 domain-containing protein n=1 Tax=unclassified Paenibacillus TaxID=185978 RepID=UPI0003E27519|nr:MULTISPECIES: DUF1835 domain-containing protein [unclassified Paenibacillus]ETT56152.1 hypothetical protein C162_01867 [Paenibacillus sp. FSL R7-269]OMG00994.1 hypothetical protein BK147_01060 [Paenibacillus sp. FSL R7-0337]
MAKAHGVSNERMEQEFVHILFGMSDAGSLKVTLSAIGIRETNHVLAFNELFSIGPLSGLDTVPGMQNRHLWMMERDEEYSIIQHHNQENRLVHMVQTVKSIPHHKIIVIWVADNAHDQTGLRFVLHVLRERIQPVHMVNVTELYHSAAIHSTEGFVPFYRGAIDRESYLSIVKKYSQGLPLESDQRRSYELDWLRLAEENQMLRLWKDAAIISCDENALDELILRSVIELEVEQERNQVRKGFVSAASVFIRVFEISQQFLGTSFILHRMRVLVNRGVLVSHGDSGDLNQFLLKRAQIY